MRHRFTTGQRNPGILAGLIFAALLAILFVTLPLGHQLFHDSPGEPEACPVHLLESSLLLLSIAVLALVKLFADSQPRPLYPSRLNQPQGFRGFFFSNRAPPRS